MTPNTTCLALRCHIIACSTGGTEPTPPIFIRNAASWARANTAHRLRIVADRCGVCRCGNENALSALFALLGVTPGGATVLAACDLQSLGIKLCGKYVRCVRSAYCAVAAGLGHVGTRCPPDNGIEGSDIWTDSVADSAVHAIYTAHGWVCCS